MAKLPKAPKFQNLPTLEGLAARRGQTIALLLEEWGVKDAASLIDRLKREGLAPLDDPDALFAAPVVPMKSALVEIVKKAPKEAESAEQNESKKPSKVKLTSDATTSVAVDRAPSKPAVVVADEAGKPSSKA